MSPSQRVVIVGGGFGGLYAAQALRKSPVDGEIVEDIRRRQPAETKTLLPYYLVADKTYERGVRSKYLTAGGLGLGGLLCFLLSFKLLASRPQEAEDSVVAAAATAARARRCCALGTTTRRVGGCMTAPHG